MKNIESTLVLGGCKSGKSRYAQHLAQSLTDSRKLYIATCVPLDQEMEERVKKHQEDRDMTWTTVEEPVHVADIVRRKSADYGVILLDCLTLWVTNLLMAEVKQDEILRRTGDLCAAVRASSCPVVLVSNEVGAGIVPENSLARLFRDVQGIVNQIVARSADRVVVTFAGLPLTLKGKAVL